MTASVRLRFLRQLFVAITNSFLFGVAWLVSCTPQSSPTPTPDTSEIWAKWQSSPHADTYALEKGPNTYCARCHSPRNWDPQATIDSPPNCVSCKFASEDRPRLAAGNPLVPESEWKDIGCPVCHPPTNGGVDGETVSWLNAATGEHESVDTMKEICEKCHRDTETLRHQRDLTGSAHAEYTCTDCHDPHSTAASCTAGGCHPNVFTNSDQVDVHDPAHKDVSCVACHDATGLPVHPLDEKNTWMTFRTRELLGQSTTKPYQSHVLQEAVDCQRCHYAGNPWHLIVPVGEENSS